MASRITFQSGRTMLISEDIGQIINGDSPGLLVGVTRIDGEVQIIGTTAIETIEPYV